MRAAPAKRRNPGPPLTPIERTSLDALLEQTDVIALRALIRDALGIRDAMPSHREERMLLRRAVAHAKPPAEGGELAAHEVHALDSTLGETSSPQVLRALIRDAVGLDSLASEPTTRALLRRAVASCDTTTLLDNSDRSHAAYDR